MRPIQWQGVWTILFQKYDTVKHQEYLYKLKSELLPLSEETDFVFIQDGTPPHFKRFVPQKNSFQNLPSFLPLF